MAYRIDYEAGGTKAPIKERKRVTKKQLACCLIAVVVLVFSLWPTARTALWYWILPGDGKVTATAIQGMVEDLREGNSVGDAVTAFCQEIIAGGSQ